MYTLLIPNSDGTPEDLDEVMKGGRHVEIHTPKWKRCIQHVTVANAKRGTEYSPYAVCTASIGYSGSYSGQHRMGARTPGGRQKKLKNR